MPSSHRPRIWAASALCLFWYATSPLLDAARADGIPTAKAAGVFSEANRLCRQDHGRLWGRSLCGPILFVDPESLAVAANHRDADGALTPAGGVFIGRLPPGSPVANTAATWSGTLWTEVVWPLPEDAVRRDVLLTHEMFHRIQQTLPMWPLDIPDNGHLDTLDGRFTLRLEWRALARALAATDERARRQACADALLFRAARYRKFPRAAEQELRLELNEGLAEYTGVMAGAPANGRVAAALHDLSGHEGDPSYVRSFAYATGPAYGLLLDRYAPGWRHRLTQESRLADRLAMALAIQEPADLDGQVALRQADYDGTALFAAEQDLDRKRQAARAAAEAKFIGGPVLKLPLHNKQITFDPLNLIPLGDAGTVYPTLNVSDDWGTLTVTDGALIAADWNEVIVSATGIDTAAHAGSGWTLDLHPGWTIAPAARIGDLMILAQQSAP
jgi:hypothetical protein